MLCSPFDDVRIILGTVEQALQLFQGFRRRKKVKVSLYSLDMNHTQECNLLQKITSPDSSLVRRIREDIFKPGCLESPTTNATAGIQIVQFLFSSKIGWTSPSIANSTVVVQHLNTFSFV